ncbi:unnamed protein product [Didymodactylos carnosus]|uniref:Uncharacterized protein n=1 Tax=Didymodactylos carnosus TaxID=1234261 RepID=A0A8S2EUL6_9BILA|nr:unnamed protein product [Didymodactylos carnosus]CAF4112365.1 unnamed protein product [Didymodactylos carnosus]
MVSTLNKQSFTLPTCVLWPRSSDRNSLHTTYDTFHIQPTFVDFDLPLKVTSSYYDILCGYGEHILRLSNSTLRLFSPRGYISGSGFHLTSSIVLTNHHCLEMMSEPILLSNALNHMTILKYFQDHRSINMETDVIFSGGATRPSAVANKIDLYDRLTDTEEKNLWKSIVKMYEDVADSKKCDPIAGIISDFNYFDVALIQIKEILRSDSNSNILFIPTERTLQPGDDIILLSYSGKAMSICDRQLL